MPKNDERFDSTYFVLVHSMPRYAEDANILQEFLIKHYKKAKLNFKGSNTTYASFIIVTDGSVKNLKFLRPPANNEVLRKLEKIMANMAKWLPGECDNKAVPVLYNLPLKY
ncbi:MAG: hypothetical protein M3Q95_02570 [Bacteroidota bacterium]|nr:hypothetical protein [Bacteroidota bacterium]